MCQSISEGGQRCASHTKDKLDAVSAKVQRAVEANDLTALVNAKDEWSKAAAEYASTPTGEATLKQMRDDASLACDIHTEVLLNKALEEGLVIKQKNAEIAALVKAARAVSNVEESPSLVEQREAAQARADEEERVHLTQVQARFKEDLSNPQITPTDLCQAYKTLHREVPDAWSTKTRMEAELAESIRKDARQAVINHPNADEKVFKYTGARWDEKANALSQATTPSPAVCKAIRDLPHRTRYYGEGEDDAATFAGPYAVWRARATQDADINAALAFNDPDPSARAQALSRLAGTPLRNLSAAERSQLLTDLKIAGGRDVEAAEHKKIMDGLMRVVEYEADPAERMSMAGWLAENGYSWSLRRRAKGLAEPLVEAS